MKRQEELVQAARKEYPEWEEAQCHFIDGAHYADSHPHWINIEDELPKEKGLIITTSSGEFDLFFYEGESAIVLKDMYDITYWMPLPQPATKEE